jgi:DNA/RNA-binding domain of Phe-tRNA-synthetase-like protein
MKKFIAETAFWEVFPEAAIGILVVNGINNKADTLQLYQDMLDSAVKKAKSFINGDDFSQSEDVRVWRQAFSKFKTKKGARSSIEALLKRVSQDRTFSPINPLVDIYNSISLSYALPCGGEDLDKIKGNLVLGKADGSESFRPLGEEKDSPALPEEIIYKDEAGAVCRCLNWREAQRTMLTEKTVNALLVMEAVTDEQKKRLETALEVLKGLVETHFKRPARSVLLTSGNPEAVIGE